jgi:hypothetical protein
MNSWEFLLCNLILEPHSDSRKSLLPASRVGFGGVSD